MKKQNLYFLLFISLVSSAKFFAQEISMRDRFRYQIKRATSSIKIDGVESDGEWNNSQLIDTLYNHNPSDIGGVSKNSSEIRLSYDDKNLYIFAKHYDEGKRIIQSLQRDSYISQWGSDSFTIAIDPINKKQSGIMIGVNAGGAELDGNLLIGPSRTTYSDVWDTRWLSSTKQYENYWLVEIAIPFTSLRYNKDNLEWGINFVRGDKIENIYTTWTEFPINFNSIDVNYMGTLEWPEVPDVKNKIAFIKPYATVSALKDNELENNTTDYQLDAGADVKLAITKSLNADITFNPDFSNAEVDEEITNITRFDISLPEQREFFVENADIFSSFGNDEVNPFFSRRIGLSAPIVYGARITGNVTENLRIGAMNVQTKENTDVDAQNNTVAAFNYKVLDRSQLKGIFVSRQEIGNDAINDYARNYGAEFTYVSKKGNFNNNIKYHKSSTDEELNGEFFGIQGNYITRTFGSGWNFNTINKNYEANLGFTPRLFNYDAETGETIRQSYTLFNPWVRYTHYVKNQSSKITSHGVRTWHNFFYDGGRKLYEREHNVAYDLIFKNASNLTVSGHYRDVDLRFETNFLGDEFDNLPVQNYNFLKSSITYYSNDRTQFTYNASASYGDFFNGKITTLSTTGNVRFGYWGNFSLSYAYNDISLPENYGEIDLHLVKFKGLLSFTNKLFFNNTVQYNSQSENFSVFSRLQWRYSSLSDIFLIYNQNNNTTNNGFGLKNRSIILKITYRLGV